MKICFYFASIALAKICNANILDMDLFDIRDFVADAAFNAVHTSLVAIESVAYFSGAWKKPPPFRFSRAPTPIPKVIPKPPPTPELQRYEVRVCQPTSKVDWTYNSNCTYEKNGQLPPAQWHIKYPKCNGTRQSPVNIVPSRVYSDCYRAPASGIFVYETGNCTYDNLQIAPFVENWSILLNEKSCLGRPSLRVNGIKYNFQKIEFHTKSEHIWNFESNYGEMHLIHYNSNNASDLLHLAVMLNLNKSISGYTKIVEYIGALDNIARRWDRRGKRIFRGETPQRTDLWDPYSLVPYKGMYFTYMGSLTRPPCTENVRWVVFRDVLDISQTDLNLFRNGIIEQTQSLVDIRGFNARDYQDLNAREVFQCWVNHIKYSDVS